MRGRHRVRVFLSIVGLAGMWTLLGGGVASADDFVIQVTGPEQAALGEPVEIVATVRNVSDGRPAAGVTVVFSSDAEFAGVKGNIERGRVATNEIGVAEIFHAFTELRTHTLRVEILDDPTAEPQAVTFPVVVGRQLFESEHGIVIIPGLGGWLVTLVIGAVWAIMVFAFAWVVGVSLRTKADEGAGSADGSGRSAPPMPAFNLAVTAFSIMTVLAIGLVVLLLRSPETHSNRNPSGYDRTAVAYVEASYDYPGTGLSPEALAGEGVVGGQTLFLSKGCAGCHGLNAEGTAAASSPASASREWLETVVRSGIAGLMPRYSQAELGVSDLDKIHAFLVAEYAAGAPAAGEAPPTTATATTSPPPSSVAAAPTFGEDVAPILSNSCAACHGTSGGWSVDDYASVMGTGDHEPVVVAGDPDASLLVKVITGVPAEAPPMPPGGSLDDTEIQTIIDWIIGGARP